VRRDSRGIPGEGEARGGLPSWESILSLDYYDGNGDDDLFGRALPVALPVVVANNDGCLLDGLDVSEDSRAF